MATTKHQGRENGQEPSAPIGSAEVASLEDSDRNASPAADNLNKIRDILFGEQVQTQHQRFERLEDRLSQECADLRTDFHTRLDQLESRLSHRLDNLFEQLRREETTRGDETVALRQTVDEVETLAERRSAQLEEKLDAIAHDLQADIKHQTLTLKENLEGQLEELLAELENETTERKRSGNAERAKLAALFGDLSKQLENPT